MGTRVYLHNNDAILQIFGLGPAPSDVPQCPSSDYNVSSK